MVCDRKDCRHTGAVSAEKGTETQQEQGSCASSFIDCALSKMPSGTNRSQRTAPTAYPTPARIVFVVKYGQTRPRTEED